MSGLKCTIMRGGTSKGVFFHENVLARDEGERTRQVLRILGSPDRRQIDGLGGADILTSKVAMVGPPSRENADVDYIFGQVGVTEAVVDWRTICGNLSAAVGPFAVDEGLVRTEGTRARVRVFCKNVGKFLGVEFEVRDGKAVYEGDYSIDGVPGTGAKISLDYSDTVGVLTGSLLPTGRRRDVLDIDEFGQIEVSILDISTPVAFIRARDVGVDGTESAKDLDGNGKLIGTLEKIRRAAARVARIDGRSVFMPMLALVHRPLGPREEEDDPERSASATIGSKIYAAGMMHKAYPGTGCVTTGVAAKMKGSIAHEFVQPEEQEKETVTIGHFSGQIAVDVRCKDEGESFSVQKAVMFRTARRILDGHVYL